MGQDRPAQDNMDASRAGLLAICLELPGAFLLLMVSWGLAGGAVIDILTIVAVILQQRHCGGVSVDV